MTYVKEKYIHFLKDFYSFIRMCLSVLPACVFVHHMCAWGPQKLEEGVESPETGIMDSDLPMGAGN